MPTYLSNLFIMLLKIVVLKTYLFVQSWTFQAMHWNTFMFVSLCIFKTENMDNFEFKCMAKLIIIAFLCLKRQSFIFNAISIFDCRHETIRKHLIFRRWRLTMLKGSPCTVSGLKLSLFKILFRSVEKKNIYLLHHSAEKV